MAFQSIKVWQVTSLRTYMMLKTGDAEWIRIQHSEDNDRECYIEKDSDGSTSFYFVASEPDDGFRWDNLADDITIMIKEILQSKLDFRYIRLLISYIGIEEQIPTRLNKMRVPHYSVSKTVEKSLFPAPGTYVPVKFHPFLDNARPIFDMHEYRFVAMEKYDPLTDDENNDDSALAATYIYVTIVERIDKNSGTFPMYQRYRVDEGKVQYVTVPAYKLYRIRRKTNMVRDVVQSDSTTDRATLDLETTQEAPEPQLYSDACKEIRECLRKSWDAPEQRSIIKCLRLKWHPDKGQGQQEICHRVFVYLQQCIYRLENGQPLQEETDDTENVNEAQQNFASSSYASFFSRMNDRFYTYHDTYEQEEFPSAFSHRESAREPQPSPSEARIWKRQAESDLQDAKISMENYPLSDQQGIPAANWICYRCHQAEEKALKAVWFFKDANELHDRDIRLSHRLEQIANGLDVTFRNLASRMTSLTGDHTRMRYPDAHGQDRIPADMYTREQAEECCCIAQEVIEEVSRVVN